MRIVPSILIENFEDFLSLISDTESFTDYVQIDIMNEVFVPLWSFPAERINTLKTFLAFQLHLTHADPISLMDLIDNECLKK
jgi:pentose-5-phosphate-3-epimerase